MFIAGVVHEHPRIGSDGESEEGSRTSEDVVSPANRGAVASGGQNVAGVNGNNRHHTNNGNTTMGAGPYVGVKMRQKNNIAGNGGRDNMGARKLSSQEEINKRLSLPADLKLPDNFVEKQAVSPTLEGPLSRATRRQSLSEIGFGRMDTYTKLDKLGEVSGLINTKKRKLVRKYRFKKTCFCANTLFMLLSGNICHRIQG